MISLQIDAISVQTEENVSILKAALAAGIPMTHLCADEISGVKGNCGLCLVEIEGRDGLFRACETLAEDGMKVLTDTPAVRQAIKVRAARLFTSHPADCSACSKTGGCAIQKICAKYRPGLASTQRTGRKRKLLDWIECDDEKCIKCGRCAAFLKKSGAGDGKTMPPESCPSFFLSGTLADICPSGALTETTREWNGAWEIKHVQSIDVTDCMGTKTDVQVADGRVVRVTPAEPDGLVSDKARFCLDGLSSNRLDRPYRRVDGQLEECTWPQALAIAANKIKAVSAGRMAGLIGDYADCETMLAMHDIFALKGADAIDARPSEEMYFDVKSRQSYLFNTPFSRIGEADALLCVGADIDALAPALAFQLRQNPMPKMFVGKKPESCLPYEMLSADLSALKDISDGSGRGAALLRQAEKPMVIVGFPLLQRPDAAAAMDLIYRVCDACGVIGDDWNGYNFLTDKVSVLGALELGLIPEEPLMPRIRRGDFDLIYLLNEDRFLHSDAPDAFVIYQGIYNSGAAKTADLVLPALSFAEKRATYLNLQGMAQSTSVALPPFGQSREDWKILRALSDSLETAPLPYDDLDDIRDALAGKSVVFYEREKVHKADDIPFGKAGNLSETPLTGVYDPFSDELSRQSQQAGMLRWRNR